MNWFKKNKPEATPQASLSSIDLQAGSVLLCGLRVDAFTPYFALQAIDAPRVIESTASQFWTEYKRQLETPVLLDTFVFDKVFITACRSNEKDALMQYPKSICFETRNGHVRDTLNSMDLAQYGGRQITDSQYRFPWGILWLDDISIRMEYRVAQNIAPAGPRCGIFDLMIGEGELSIALSSSYSDMVAKMHRDKRLIGQHSSPRFMVHENQPKFMSTMKFENVQFAGLFFSECLVYAEAGIITKIVFGDGHAGKTSWEKWLRREFALDVNRPVYTHHGENYMEFPLAGRECVGVMTHGHNISFSLYEQSQIVVE